MTNYQYFIEIGSIDSKSLKKSEQPKILKINKDSFNIKVIGDEMEGPFLSLANLKTESKIYSQIINVKTRQNILNPKNIREIENLILLPFEHSYEPNFIKLFLHAWIGKISKNKISGIHFCNPENTKILKVVDINESTGVYSAIISYFDMKNNVWVEKLNPTNFFPDNWTLQKLFKELDNAYTNKIHSIGSVYIGHTSENIKVKIVIKEDNALTMYPII